MTTELLLCLLAPAVGSFLGLLYDRLPRGEDVLCTSSRCRGCSRRLGLRDLVPILSWFQQRGRCRTCAAAIPLPLLLIELAATAVALLSFLVAPIGPRMATGCLFGWLLIPLAAIDLRHQSLPNILTATLFLAGLLAAASVPPPGVQGALLGALAGSGAFLALRLTYFWLRGAEGLGLGDVKLMAALGTWLGVNLLPFLVLVAAGGGLAVTGFRAWMRGYHLSTSDTVPLGAYLCGAGMLVWLLKTAGHVP